MRWYHRRDRSPYLYRSCSHPFSSRWSAQFILAAVLRFLVGLTAATFYVVTKIKTLSLFLCWPDLQASQARRSSDRTHICPTAWKMRWNHGGKGPSFFPRKYLRPARFNLGYLNQWRSCCRSAHLPAFNLLLTYMLSIEHKHKEVRLQDQFTLGEF